MPKVLVASELSQAGLEPLTAADGIEVCQHPVAAADELAALVPGCDALLVRSRPEVTAEVLRAGAQLQVVARAGTGVDNIDLAAATEQGVLVVNAPTGNSVAAAEHTLAMLMALSRNIPQADADMRAGNWNRSRWVGTEVRDKVLGAIGLGRVAAELVKVANELGMRVVACDPYITEQMAAQQGVELVELDSLLATADFISIHVPLVDANRHLLGREALAKVKPTACILNVARGGLVDEEALLEALNEGRLAGAALDVFETEPLPPDSPLFSHPAVIMTPHLGASTVEAQDRVARDVAQQVLDVLEGRQARYAVNAPIVPPRDLEYLVPYVDLAARMGNFLQKIDSRVATQVELTLHGPIADMDSAFLRASAVQGLLSGLMEERVNVVNADQLAAQRGMNLMERRQVQHSHRYENMVTMRVTHAEDRWTVRGSVLQGIPSIVSVNDMWVEFAAEGHILMTSHMDRPGMIGRVGTLLGNADVNISFMHVGRRAPRHEAIMVIGTDEPPSPDVYDAIAALEEFVWVKSIRI